MKNGTPGRTADMMVKSYDKRIVIKWWKMLTLVNNPSLIVDRLQRQIKEHKEERSTKAKVVVSHHIMFPALNDLAARGSPGLWITKFFFMTLGPLVQLYCPP